jgi:DNA-binding NtrC family response regulator
MAELTTASQAFAALSARATELVADAEQLRAALQTNIQESKRLLDQVEELRVTMAIGTESLGGVQLKDLETAAVLNSLELAGGNRTHAARMLGVSVRTIERKLKSLGWLEGEAATNGDGLTTSRQRAS